MMLILPNYETYHAQRNAGRRLARPSRRGAQVRGACRATELSAPTHVSGSDGWRRARTRGSILLITMAFGLVVGTVLGSYLLLTSLRNEEASRSLAWNTGIPVLEAGIEEGLTHLNSDINDPTANWWTADTVNGHPVYWKMRSLPDGSYYYVTNLNISSSTPLIISA